MKERSHSKSKPYRLEIADQSLLLHPTGAVFWGEQSTLFVADLHLGKSTSFRRGGIPVPAGSTNETFTRLTRCLDELGPRRLVVLGDLVHAKCSWDDELLEGLSRIAGFFSDDRFVLIEGNHDRGSRSRWEKLPVRLHSAPYSLPPWTLLHDEATERPAISEGFPIFLAGHVHPAFALSGAGERLRFRCFTWHNQCLTLPAFGAFTGCRTVESHPDQKIFAVVEDRVILMHR